MTVSRYASKYIHLFLSFRRVLNVICSFLGNSPAPGNYPKRNELQTYSRFHMWSMPTESNVDLAEFTNYASRLLKLWFVFRKYGRFHDPRSRLLSPVLGEVGWGGENFSTEALPPRISPTRNPIWIFQVTDRVICTQRHSPCVARALRWVETQAPKILTHRNLLKLSGYFMHHHKFNIRN